MNNFVCLNLQNIFNHKCFLEEQEIMNSNDLKEQGLEADKLFFKSSYYPASLEKVYVESVPFISPDMSVDKYDNILCSGQFIPVSNAVYRKIHILGFSEVVRVNNDIISMIYQDQISEHIEIAVMNWGLPGRLNHDSGFQFIQEAFENNCKTALIGKNTNNTSVGCTYLSSNLCRNNDILSQIHLPDNPFLHLLAITLEK